MTRELRAAGITGPRLVAAYEASRRLNAEHGRTYYLATLLLPPAKRPFVHALYGFARYADDIVDAGGSGAAPDRAQRLRRFRAEFDAAWRDGTSRVPVIAAVIDTAARWGIPRAHFSAFLTSMEMDLTVASYATYADLQRYMYGSAAVIGLQMLPILEPTDPQRAAGGAARLGEAFQLANFIRDVAEDLDRGRVYLPLDELARWGVTPATLATRRTDDALRHAVAEQVARVRRLSEESAPAIVLLHPSVRDCIDTARVLYCGIADQIEAADYDVFARRARVPLPRRLRVAGRGWVRARRARRRYGGGSAARSPITAATPAARSGARAAGRDDPRTPRGSG